MRTHSLGEEMSGAFAGARAWLSNLLDLFTIEARHAGLTLMLLLGCAAAGAVLVASAWLALMLVFVLWAVGHGVMWEATFAAIACINLVLAALVYWLFTRVSADGLFPATRRQLRARLRVA
jgi:uncharacterized membrane protein YqjE